MQETVNKWTMSDNKVPVSVSDIWAITLYFIISDIGNVFVTIFFSIILLNSFNSHCRSNAYIIATVGHVYFFLHQREKDQLRKNYLVYGYKK